MRSTRGRQGLIVIGVMAAVLTGPAPAPALAASEPVSTQRPSTPDRVGPRQQARDAGESGMPVAPVILFTLLMLVGVGAVALLVKHLDIRGARRATAALAADTVEDELQQMIVETVARQEAPAGPERSTRPRR